MSKQVVSSPKNKKAFASQQAMLARMQKSKLKGEVQFREGGKRLRDSKRRRH